MILEICSIIKSAFALAVPCVSITWKQHPKRYQPPSASSRIHLGGCEDPRSQDVDLSRRRWVIRDVPEIDRFFNSGFVSHLDKSWKYAQLVLWVLRSCDPPAAREEQVFSTGQKPSRPSAVWQPYLAILIQILERKCYSFRGWALCFKASVIASLTKSHKAFQIPRR